MTIKTILVPLRGLDEDAPALTVAIQLAGEFSSHIEAIHPRPDPKTIVPYIGDAASGTLIQDIMDAAARDAAEQSERAKALFERLGAAVARAESPQDAGPSINWREVVGDVNDVVARRGRLFDLVVCARPQSADDIEAQMLVEAILFNSGRPVLLVPPQPPASVGDCIAIGWNDSAPAARAIADAAPFLSRASRVSVLCIGKAGTAPADPAGRGRRPGLARRNGAIVCNRRGCGGRRRRLVRGGVPPRLRPAGHGRFLTQPPARADPRRCDPRRVADSGAARSD